jgi:hypothetical protein
MEWHEVWKRNRFFLMQKWQKFAASNQTTGIGDVQEESDLAPLRAVSSATFSHQSRDIFNFTDSSLSILSFCRQDGQYMRHHFCGVILGTIIFPPLISHGSSR